MRRGLEREDQEAGSRFPSLSSSSCVLNSFTDVQKVSECDFSWMAQIGIPSTVESAYRDTTKPTQNRSQRGPNPSPDVNGVFLEVGVWGEKQFLSVALWFSDHYLAHLLAFSLALSLRLS